MTAIGLEPAILRSQAQVNHSAITPLQEVQNSPPPKKKAVHVHLPPPPSPTKLFENRCLLFLIFLC